MILYRTGDVLDVAEGIIVHGCNCQGVMGAGIALRVKELFPTAYKAYVNAYNSGEMKPGDITLAEVAPNKIIVNAVTQNYYGRIAGVRYVSYDAIALCFEKVYALARSYEDSRNKKLPILFPKIGAGLGGGDWRVIEAIIDQAVPDSFHKVCYTRRTGARS